MLSTKFDPLFLLLPILKDCASERFVPLQQAEDPDGVLDHIMPLVEKTAPKIAETSDKMSPRFLLVKYSQSKTEAWLKRRIQRTADVLATMQGSGTSTSSFSLRSESTSGSTTAGGGGGGSTEEVAPKASRTYQAQLDEGESRTTPSLGVLAPAPSMVCLPQHHPCLFTRLKACVMSIDDSETDVLGAFRLVTTDADIMQAIDIVSDCLNESWDLELCRIME